VPELSILIPARNEEWLPETVADVLEHTSDRTEVIVVLDGAWPVRPLPQHGRVQVIYLPESIGQRAATNLAARVSTAPYICKLDAHCSVADGFDGVLIDAAKELGPGVTQIPAQTNLHVFDWVCDPCSFRADQSPALRECPQCKGQLRKEVVWKPRQNTRTRFWRFTSEPKFDYWNGYNERPESKGDICDVMTSLGACFFMARERFWQLGGLDEAGGVWGSYGIEIACKSWLSGGRHVVNKKTSFSHFFRVGGHGFPYELKASQQEAARRYCREMWFNNRWPGQVRPLSWLLEKFWPVPGWSESEFASIRALGATFRVNAVPVMSVVGDEQVSPAQDALSLGAAGPLVDLGGGQEVPPDAVSARTVGPNAPALVLLHGHEVEVGGVAASPISTEVVELWDVLPAAGRDGANKPSVDEPVGQRDLALEGQAAIAAVAGTCPDPAPVYNGDLAEYACKLLAVEMWDVKGFSSHASASTDVRLGALSGLAPTDAPFILIKSAPKGIVHYTDGRIGEWLSRPVRNSLEASGLPIVSVNLQCSFDWRHRVREIWMDGEPSHLTMFRQILAGLEELPADYAFLCEHDVLYHHSHFDFVPPRDDVYYYNLNVWKVDAQTGRAVTYDTKQTSGLCANRELLVQHYRRRVARVEREGFSRRMGFEPGSHRRSERIDDIPSDTWRSAFPNLDIRHSKNLTATRWSPEQFRDKRNCQGWKEADEVPGWGVTKGRMAEIFAGVASAVQQAVA
jgi:glycosyltransferase involved in cell wall biosynthesis